MKKLMASVASFIRDEEGLEFVEYGLAVGVIAAVSGAAWNAIDADVAKEVANLDAVAAVAPTAIVVPAF